MELAACASGAGEQAGEPQIRPRSCQRKREAAFLQCGVQGDYKLSGAAAVGASSLHAVQSAAGAHHRGRSGAVRTPCGAGGSESGQGCLRGASQRSRRLPGAGRAARARCAGGPGCGGPGAGRCNMAVLKHTPGITYLLVV